MGYYDIFHLYENEEGWRRSRREADELVLEEGGRLVCPLCLRPLMRARIGENGCVLCPHCGGECGLEGYPRRG